MRSPERSEAMIEPARDNPGVLVFPPLIPLANLLLGVALGWLAPLGILARLPQAPRIAVGVLACLIGLAMMIAARREFRRGGTNAVPSKPALALLTTGIFAWTRNPMYVGGGFLLIGIALVFALDWVPLLYVPSLLLLHFGIVRREERYLERKFGADYRAYKAHVGRYVSLV
jgi:protein-S-isoprenylcysteine O-methyltransferase Ste14